MKLKYLFFIVVNVMLIGVCHLEGVFRSDPPFLPNSRREGGGSCYASLGMKDTEGQSEGGGGCW